MGQTKPETVYVRQMPLGPKKNFVYLVGAPNGQDAFVIDPAWDVAAITRQLEEDGRRLCAIVLTHHHDDHVNGVPALLQLRDVPVHVQQAEFAFAPEAFAPFSGAVKTVAPGESLKLAGLEVGCLHTPGHTPGSQCLLCGGALFTGDTLFVNACGRCDFEGGDPEAMYGSLFNTLGALEGATTVYTGHHYGDVQVSSLARERERNPYFQLKDRAAFVKHRMTPR
jgi:glyoxylase-like metal-dependent hydrolase (beta-lactamase superfamily II)